VFKGDTYGASLAVDGDSATAWCEGVADLGVGEWLQVTLTEPLEIAEVKIQGGFYKSDRTLMNNGRPRRLLVTSDRGFSSEVTFEPVLHRQYSSSKVSVRETSAGSPGLASSLKLTLLEAEAGEWTSDTCLSEVVITTLVHAPG